MTPVIEGDNVEFITSSPFTSISGVVINPDIVTFSYIVQGQTEVSYTWTNPTGDPTNNIINTSTGNFSITLPTNGLAGTWSWGWIGSSTPGGPDTTSTQVVYNGELLVSPSSV